MSQVENKGPSMSFLFLIPFFVLLIDLIYNKLVLKRLDSCLSNLLRIKRQDIPYYETHFRDKSHLLKRIGLSLIKGDTLEEFGKIRNVLDQSDYAWSQYKGPTNQGIEEKLADLSIRLNRTISRLESIVNQKKKPFLRTNKNSLKILEK